MLFASRVLAGLAAGGIFPILMAVVGDRVPIKQRQVAMSRLLFAAMTGSLLGASGAGVLGDLIGWRSVLIGIGAVGFIALALAMPGLRGAGDAPGRFDPSSFLPGYRAVFGNPLAKYCFGAVFVEAIFVFGLFPYVAVMLRPKASTARPLPVWSSPASASVASATRSRCAGCSPIWARNG